MSIRTLIREHLHSYTHQEADILQNLCDINVITPHKLNNRLDVILGMYPEIRDELLSLTWFAPKELGSRERILLLVQRYDGMPMCECGTVCTFNKHRGMWNRYCSKRCASKSKSVQESIDQTNKQRYGVARALFKS